MSGGQAIMDTFVAMSKEIIQLKGEKADLLEALQLFIKAGYGNSTDFTEQFIATLKAKAAIAKDTSGEAK